MPNGEHCHTAGCGMPRVVGEDDSRGVLCDDGDRAQVQHGGARCAADHYHIPPLERIDLDVVLGLVRDKKYFVLHAPRQTGKTSSLLALRDLLNGGGHGDFRCVYANVEGGQAMPENVAEGMRTVLAELALRASVTLGDETLNDLWPGTLERVAGHGTAASAAALEHGRSAAAGSDRRRPAGVVDRGRRLRLRR